MGVFPADDHPNLRHGEACDVEGACKQVVLCYALGGINAGCGNTMDHAADFTELADHLLHDPI